MSRAEYQRAYRAARRTQPADHVCEGCGKTFTPGRKDARFCSDACRSAKWRPIVHHAVHHKPGGFARQTCGHELGPGEFCGAPAPWRHDYVHNTERDLVFHGFYCGDHIGLHHPAGVTVGESIRDVMARDGRVARGRHGTPV